MRPVLLAGTSLTAVDIATELLQNGHTAQIIAVSRRGLLPRSHGPIAAASEGFVHALPSSLREVVRYVRELSANDPRGDKWRRVFTELRSIAPSLWRNWTVAERRRFLRHVRPFWDAHRHRLAPRVHGKIERAIASGQLVDRSRPHRRDRAAPDARRPARERSPRPRHAALDVARARELYGAGGSIRARPRIRCCRA